MMVAAVWLALGVRELLLLSLGAVVLLFIFFFLLYRREQKLAEYETQVDLAAMSPKWLETKARQLIAVEAYRFAGDIKARLGQWREAADLYLKGQNPLRAAECELELKDLSRAAELFFQANHHERAAKLFGAAGDQTSAARVWLAGGEPIKAAVAFEAAAALEDAAKIYLEQGMFRKAAEIYQKAEQSGQAAEAMSRAFEAETARLEGAVAAAESMPLRIMARRAGELFKQAGRKEEAIAAYGAGGWLREKAEALHELGRLAEAGEAYLELGELLAAADCYKDANLPQQAAGLKARYHLEAGREREAVHFLEEAGDFARAAELHQRHQNWSAAGANYEKAGVFKAAAEMFEKAGEFERGAEVLLQAQDFRAAAALYGRAQNYSAQAETLEKAGEFLEAGLNYFQRGLHDKAIAALQQVAPDQPGHADAALALGQIFKEKGLSDLALEYFRRAVAEVELGRDHLEPFYQLALGEERGGAIGEAARLYEQILVIDFHFKDVADRLHALKGAATQIETPSTPSSPYAATISRSDAFKVPTEPGRDSRVGERYTLRDEIGRGGMGIVFKAMDNVLDRTVAFKILPANLKDHPQALANFRREAQSAAKLNHPNIVTVYDAGDAAGTYYIAMEFIEGETVKALLNREGKLPLRATLMIAGQVCKALEYAHGRKIVHRDIKSSNIMWTPEKQVKLMDFGLAKVIEEVKGYQTIASGTPYYMSPEQALGRNIDHRTDLYSLGVTIFEMITGKLPFLQGDAAYHHVHTPPPHPREIDPEVDAAIDQIIYRLLQKKPDLRFQSAADLFAALRQVMAV